MTQSATVDKVLSDSGTVTVLQMKGGSSLVHRHECGCRSTIDSQTHYPTGRLP